MRKLLLFILVSTSAFGANVCVGPASSGSASGADWSNKKQWSSLTPVRGDVYYLEDGAYAAKTLSTAASGTTLITIRKATVADHGSSTGWSDTMGDGQAVIANTLTLDSPYWVIDGAARSGIRSGYGIVVDNYTSPIANANGSLRCGTTNPSQADGTIIRYVEVHGSNNLNYSSGFADEGITTPANTGGASQQTDGLTIEYCWIHETGGSNFGFRYSSAHVVQYCVIERNHSSNAAHAEGFVLSHTVNTTIRYNLISDIEGTGYIATPSGTHNTVGGLYVYGNVFETPTSPTRGGVGDGIVAIFDCDVTGGLYFYNNTIVNFRDAVTWPGGTTYNYTNPGFDIGIGNVNTSVDVLVCANNLWVSCDAPANPTLDPDSNIASFSWVNNAVYSTTMFTGTGVSGTQTIGTMPLTAWTSGDYTLTGATTAGTTLSSPYATDPTGASRGADGTWDRGAYEYASGGGGDTTAPTPNPATFASVTANSSSQITVVATTASDETALHATPYDFAINGAWQGYQSSATKVFTGLTASTSYAFKTRTKDAAGNVTSESSVTNRITDAAVGPLTITTATATNLTFP